MLYLTSLSRFSFFSFCLLFLSSRLSPPTAWTHFLAAGDDPTDDDLWREGVACLLSRDYLTFLSFLLLARTLLVSLDLFIC